MTIFERRGKGQLIIGIIILTLMTTACGNGESTEPKATAETQPIISTSQDMDEAPIVNTTPQVTVDASDTTSTHNEKEDNNPIEFLSISMLDSYPDARVDITSIQSLNSNGMAFHKEKLYTGAAILFKKATELEASDSEKSAQALAYYNLACTISLLYNEEAYHNLDECLGYLESSFLLRADRVSRATKDVDFNNIKDTTEFKALIDKHKEKISASNLPASSIKFESEILYSQGEKIELNYEDHRLVIITDQKTTNENKLTTQQVTLDETTIAPVKFYVIGKIDNVVVSVDTYHFPEEEGALGKIVRDKETNIGSVSNTVLEVNALLPSDTTSIGITATYTDTNNVVHELDFGFDGMRDAEDYTIIIK